MKQTILTCDVCKKRIPSDVAPLGLFYLGKGWWALGENEEVPPVMPQQLLDVCGEECLHKKIAEIITKDTRLPSNPDQPMQCQRLKPLHA